MPANYIEDQATLKEGITLFTAPSPNGRKIPIYLELLGLKYDVRAIDFSKNEQKSAWFKKYNPNGKVPVLLVVDNKGDVKEAIPESGAILQYISEQLDTKGEFSYKVGDKNHYREVEWAYFHLSTFSPTAFESLYFNHLSTEKDAFGIKRFSDETNRIVDILEAQLTLEGTGYIVGPHISTVDILFYPWLKMADMIAVDLSTRPSLKAWYEKLSAIDAFKVGAEIPS